MDFPMLTLRDTAARIAWIEQHFHPDGFGCPHCQASLADARLFRSNRGSTLPVYRCRKCQGVDTRYTRTIFEGAQLVPTQVVLLLRGVFHGQSSEQLARELELTEKTVLKWRHRLNDRAAAIQPATPLPDTATERGEMFQNAGGKKAGSIAIRKTRRAVERISGVGVGRLPMTGRQSWERSGE
jgi:transposase-like protein